MNLTSWLKSLGNSSNQPRRRQRDGDFARAAMVESLEPRKMLTAGPVIAAVGSGFTYTEGAPAILIAPHATVTDSASAFANSKLIVTTTNGVNADQLSILNGNGVGVSPTGDVMYASSKTSPPIQIGTVAGGMGNSPLKITFNSKATSASVQAVLDQVGYGDGVSTLKSSTRSIEIQMVDGTGAKSVPVTETATVNAAPVVGKLGMPLVYLEGAPPAPIAPKGQINDAANAYANSSLTVKINNSQPGDQLGIAPGQGVDLGPNGAVLFKSSPTSTPVQIGTVTGGTGSTPLTVTFNSKATQATVNAVLDQIVYANRMSTQATPDRMISIVFTDGNKVASVPVIQGVHVNPAPVIGQVPMTPVTDKVNGSPVVLAPNAVIADAGGPTAFANSSLDVKLMGGVAGDAVSIQAKGSLTLGANSTLFYNGVAIGTYSGGTGTSDLVIKFNAKATQASVQAVLDNITFAYATKGTPVLTNRQIGIVFTDGNKVASAPTIVGIQVSK